MREIPLGTGIATARGRSPRAPSSNSVRTVSSSSMTRTEPRSIIHPEVQCLLFILIDSPWWSLLLVSSERQQSRPRTGHGNTGKGDEEKLEVNGAVSRRLPNLSCVLSHCAIFDWTTAMPCIYSMCLPIVTNRQNDLSVIVLLRCNNNKDGKLNRVHWYF